MFYHFSRGYKVGNGDDCMHLSQFDSQVKYRGYIKQYCAKVLSHPSFLYIFLEKWDLLLNKDIDRNMIYKTKQSLYISNKLESLQHSLNPLIQAFCHFFK